MDKNKFWELIQESFKEGDENSDEQVEILINKLSELDCEDILKFAKIYQVYDDEAYKNKLWAAAYIMNGGCSDDCFDYFRGWLISKGEEAYLNALKDPDSLINLDIDEENDYFENEAILYVPLYAFNKRIASKNIETFYERLKNYELDPSETFDIVDTIEFGEDIDILWEEENLESLLPKLCQHFW